MCVIIRIMKQIGKAVLSDRQFKSAKVNNQKHHFVLTDGKGVLLCRYPKGTEK